MYHLPLSRRKRHSIWTLKAAASSPAATHHHMAPGLQPCNGVKPKLAMLFLLCFSTVQYPEQLQLSSFTNLSCLQLQHPQKINTIVCHHLRLALMKLWAQTSSRVDLPQASGARVSLQGFPRPWPEDADACCPRLSHSHSIPSLSTKLAAFPRPAPGECWVSASLDYSNPKLRSGSIPETRPAGTSCWLRLPHQPASELGSTRHHFSDWRGLAYLGPMGPSSSNSSLCSHVQAHESRVSHKSFPGSRQTPANKHRMPAWQIQPVSPASFTQPLPLGHSRCFVFHASTVHSASIPSGSARPDPSSLRLGPRDSLSAYILLADRRPSCYDDAAGESFYIAKARNMHKTLRRDAQTQCVRFASTPAGAVRGPFPVAAGPGWELLSLSTILSQLANWKCLACQRNACVHAKTHTYTCRP